MGDGGAQTDGGCGKFVSQPHPVAGLGHDLIAVGDRPLTAVDGEDVPASAGVKFGLVAGVIGGAKTLQVARGDRGELIAGAVVGHLDVNGEVHPGLGRAVGHFVAGGLHAGHAVELLGQPVDLGSPIGWGGLAGSQQHHHDRKKPADANVPPR